MRRASLSKPGTPAIYERTVSINSWTNECGGIEGRTYIGVLGDPEEGSGSLDSSGSSSIEEVSLLQEALDGGLELLSITAVGVDVLSLEDVDVVGVDFGRSGSNEVNGGDRGKGEGKGLEVLHLDGCWSERNRKLKNELSWRGEEVKIRGSRAPFYTLKYELDPPT